jgi:hypothetical protein
VTTQRIILSMTDDRNKAMVDVINFFNSRMNAMNKASITKTKELISTHEISVSELVDKYVDLVHKNS